MTRQLSPLLSFGPRLPVTYFAHSTKRRTMIFETMKMVKRMLIFQPLLVRSTYTLVQEHASRAQQLLC